MPLISTESGMADALVADDDTATHVEEGLEMLVGILLSFQISQQAPSITSVSDQKKLTE